MDIFVISLKDSINRKKSFDKLNSHINYKYFTAVNGKELSSLEKKKIVDNNAIGYTDPAIGCAMSHLSLWNKCIELKKPIIIMEDDLFVSNYFYKYLDSVLKMLPENWHILQLCYNCDSILGFSNTNFENAFTFFGKNKFNDKDIDEFKKIKINPTIAKLNLQFGTGCYAITPDGAKILKQKCFPMDNRLINVPMIGEIKSFTLDAMMNNSYKYLNSFVCPIPFVMTKHLYEDYQSTIDE